jgi:tetratricopeptide (TPR) repeat protein
VAIAQTPDDAPSPDAPPAETDVANSASDAVDVPTDTRGLDAARSLIDLANLQMATKEYVEAEQALTKSVALIEQVADRYDPALIEPLVLLGDALDAEGEFEKSLDAYGRAIHLTRINEGLHSPSQVDVVYKEAAVLLEMGEPSKANDRQEYAYEVLLRSYGPGNPDLIPGLYRLADWYRRTNNVFAARGMYEHAARVLHRAYGDNDPRLVPALRGVAETYRFERFPPIEAGMHGESEIITGGDVSTSTTMPATHTVNRFSDGEEALKRIVHIYQSNPNGDPEDEALAILDLADWYLLFDKWSRAAPLYAHVQELLRDKAGYTPERLAPLFGQPNPLYLALPDGPIPPPPNLRGPRTEGYVEVGYTVDDRGLVGDLKTIGSQPEGLLDFKVRKALRGARFRPRFEGENPVITKNLTYRHTFSYFPRTDGTPPPPSDGTAGSRADEPASSS